MITKEKLTRALAKFEKDKSKLTADLKVLVQDETIPLSERWDLFITSELGKKNNYIVQFDSLNTIKNKYTSKTLQDYLLDTCYSRYNVVRSDDILYWITELLTEDSEGFDITEIIIDNFKREVVTKFIYSFVYDW